jgi:hypothetical protein
MPVLSDNPVVVVSGLPRSGTSMLMRMLAAGGMPILQDDARPPDANNPHGYFEFAPVKQLRDDGSWFAGARGQAVKVVSFFLPHLPPAPPCLVLHMRREIGEVLASQAAMLARLGQAAPAGDPAPLRSAFARAEQVAAASLARRPDTDVLWLRHADTLRDPARTARQLHAFLGGNLDVDAMAAAVDPRLHRERGA